MFLILHKIASTPNIIPTNVSSFVSTFISTYDQSYAPSNITSSHLTTEQNPGTLQNVLFSVFCFGFF